jgi:alpha-beta hydrolase superfamily lysophospholipase
MLAVTSTLLSSLNEYTQTHEEFLRRYAASGPTVPIVRWRGHGVIAREYHKS